MSPLEHNFYNSFSPCRHCGRFVEETIDLRYCPGPSGSRGMLETELNRDRTGKHGSEVA